MKNYNQLKANIILDFYLDEICKFQGLEKSEALKKSRKRELADARSMTAYLAKKKFPEIKIREIANYFKFGHSDILYSITKIESLRTIDLGIDYVLKHCEKLDFVEAILKSNGFNKVGEMAFQILVGYRIARVFLSSNDLFTCDVAGEYDFNADNIDIFDALIIAKNINSNPLGVLIDSLKN